METTLMNHYRFDSTKHAHLLNNVPLKGTTTVIDEVLPPALAWYGSGMACKALGWYDRKEGRANFLPDTEGMPLLENVLKAVKNMSPKKYLSFLDLAYRAHDDYKKEKGDWGRKTHEAIEIIIKEAIKDNDGFLKKEKYENEAVERFASWGRGKKFLFSEVHVYSEKLWLGGIIDFVYKDNGVYIGDIKTSKSIYESAFIQVGMYDAQQSENGFFTSDGEKIGEPLPVKGYTIVNVPMKGGLVYKTFYDTEVLKNFAKNLVELHVLLKTLENFLYPK